jgi:hypothetical protein
MSEEAVLHRGSNPRGDANFKQTRRSNELRVLFSRNSQFSAILRTFLRHGAVKSTVVTDRKFLNTKESS